MTQSSPEGIQRALTWGKDVLVLLIFPVLIWTIKLEIGNAERDLLIAHTDTEIMRLEDRIGEMKDIDNRVQENALQLARLEGKLDTANGRLDEIRNLLLDR